MGLSAQALVELQRAFQAVEETDGGQLDQVSFFCVFPLCTFLSVFLLACLHNQCFVMICACAVLSCFFFILQLWLWKTIMQKTNAVCAINHPHLLAIWVLLPVAERIHCCLYANQISYGCHEVGDSRF